MAIIKTHTREALKKFFNNGKIPTENNFFCLIDSMINKQDDGFSKDDDNGLIISAGRDSKKIVTFSENSDDPNPFFYLKKDDYVENNTGQEISGLRFQPAAADLTALENKYLNQAENKAEQAQKQQEQEAQAENVSFFLHENGNLGLGTRSYNNYKLEVKGFTGMEGRVGTFLQGHIPANGEWHAIIEGLNNCQAFEVIARTGKKGSGKFAILHAYALSAFGKSNSKIKKVSAYYGSFWNGSFWNKINIRWKSKNTHDYALQLRTNRNYGHDVMIYYKVTKLWDDEMFLPQEYYY